MSSASSSLRPCPNGAGCTSERCNKFHSNGPPQPSALRSPSDSERSRAFIEPSSGSLSSPLLSCTGRHLFPHDLRHLDPRYYSSPAAAASLLPAAAAAQIRPQPQRAVAAAAAPSRVSERPRAAFASAEFAAAAPLAGSARASAAAPSASAAAAVASPDLDPALFVDQSVAESLTCSICFNVCSQPLGLPCSHLHCARCLQKMAQVGGLRECPACRTSFELDKCSVIQFVVKQIENMQMRCVRHAAGCEAILVPGVNGRNLAAHDTACAYRSIACAKCDAQILAKDEASHAAECSRAAQASIAHEVDSRVAAQLEPILAEMQQLRDRVSMVESAARHRDAETAALKADLSGAKTEAASLKAELCSAKADAAALQESVSTLTIELRFAKSEAAAALVQTRDSIRQLKAAQRSSAAELAQLKQQQLASDDLLRGKLASAATESNATLAALNAQFQQVSNAIAALADDQEKKRLERRVEQLELVAAARQLQKEQLEPPRAAAAPVP